MADGLNFANSREWYDREEHRVAFTGDHCGTEVIFYVSIQVLEKKFGLQSDAPHNALAVFRRNRPTAENVAAAEYLQGNVILDRAAFQRGGGSMQIDV